MQYPLNRPLREALIKHHKDVVADLERIKANCTSCENMEPGGRCAVNGDQYIPKEFQAVGCDAWSYDFIPF